MRAFRFLTLALLLLFAEQAGAAHALHHSWQQVHQEKKAPHSGACQECASFAQLGTALGFSAPDFAPLPLSFETTVPENAPFLSFRTLAETARGPPLPPFA